jgi:phosphoribosylformylglycinamidine (FGAM) synthase-like amidotransferase family enzyme
LPPDAVLPAWASHAEGRFASDPAVLERMRTGYAAFVYCRRDGEASLSPEIVPNGSLLGIAGVTNRAGNVLALMPHPERDAWGFMHPHRANGNDALSPSGGIALFESFAAALRQ